LLNTIDINSCRKTASIFLANFSYLICIKIILLKYNEPMTKIKAIISDADGTLVNTIYLIRHGQYETAVAYLLDKGIPLADIPKYETYESFINKSVGGNTRETFEKTLKLMFSQTHDEYLEKINFDDLDQNLARIQDHFAPLYVHPFHGLTELFVWMGSSQMKLGIFTSGDRRMVIRNFGVSLPVLGYTQLFLADEIDVEERFQAFVSRAKAVYGIPELMVATCENVSKTKPNPEGILMLLEKLHVKPEEVFYMGDHSTDMQAAQKAGVHAFGISHGFSSPAELKEAGAIKIIHDLEVVPRLIDNHNSGSEMLF